MKMICYFTREVLSLDVSEFVFDIHLIIVLIYIKALF